MDEKGRTSLNIAFVHPDLGIGGAERLIVDAAKALQDKGHKVTIYTSHHSKEHCFEETKKELNVEVHGDFLPRELFGRFHLLFSTIRSIFLALWIYIFCPFHFDVILVDQISYSIPILKKCTTKLLFYCHFPDKYLALSSRNPFKSLLYRRWFDKMEEKTILMADKILVNSEFTGKKFMEAFVKAQETPEILYPAVRFMDDDEVKPVKLPFSSEHNKIITSINRFERKKNLKLAIDSFCWLRENLDSNNFKNLKLIVAGGYDKRVRENVDHLRELQIYCESKRLSHDTVWQGKSKTNNIISQVIFMPSITDNYRETLLKESLCLLYTPKEEHFGIVPLEAMSRGLPVIAINSGGPLETILNDQTGYLCDPIPRSVGSKIKSLVSGSIDLDQLSNRCKDHVKNNFSMEKFQDRLEFIVTDLFANSE